MTHSIGDPDHIGVHGQLIAPLDAVAVKWGAAVSLPAAPAMGDTGHVDDHNMIVEAIRQLHAHITAQGGLVDPLPAQLPAVDVAAGDRGHVDAHNAIDAATAILEAARVPWNDATGGTVTEVANYNGTGERWRVHTFTAATGTLTVLTAPQPFRALLVGGGGAGGNAYSTSNGGQGGRGGTVNYLASTVLAVGNHSVTCGAGGPVTANTEGATGGAGSQTRLGSLVAAGGAGGPGSGGGAGGAGQLSGGTLNTITGSSVRYGENGGSGGTNPNAGPSSPTAGGGGGGAVCGAGGSYSTGASAGKRGTVIVAYRIG